MNQATTDLYFLKNYLLRSYKRVRFQLISFVREHTWPDTI